MTGLSHWDMRDGLSHRQVNAICKDRRGFIWLGTKNGLNRFDGYRFTKYTKEMNGLPFNDINRVLEDEDGNLWLKGESGSNSIVVFDPVTGKVTSFRDKTGYKGDLNFLYLSDAGNGTLLVGDREKNIYFTWNARQGLKQVRFPFARINNIVARSPDSFWLKVKDDSSFYLADGNGKVKRKVTLPFAFRDIHTRMFGPGDFITSLEGDQACYVSNDLEVKNITKNLPPKVSANDYLFVTGIADIVCRQGRFYHPEKGVIRDLVKDGNTSFKNIVRAVLMDEPGHIWMGNDFGLYLVTISRNKFRQYFYDTSHAVFHNSYRGILVADSTVYACNENNGLYAAEIGTAKSRQVPLARRDTSVSLYYALGRTRDGGIIGSFRHSIFNIPAGSKVNELYTSRDMLCWKIYETAKDRYLLGTNAGLQWLHTKTGTFGPFTEYNSYKELESAIVLDIQPGEHNGLWICSNTGLYLYAAGHGITERYSSADTGVRYLPAHDFHHLYRDAEGIYWLATTTGLVRWDKSRGQYKLYNTASGLSNDNIYAVYGDNYGRLWMSSDYGIMEIDKRTGSVKTYFVEDGLTYNEFNRVSHFQDEAGDIYFGSLNGITALSPADFPREKQLAAFPLVVTSFQQFNGQTNKLEDKLAALTKSGTITVHPSDKFFTIEFALLNYSNPEYITYHWKLGGVDTGWNVQKDRVLRFSRMPYGKRTLYIKAVAANGSRSSNELQLQLDVVPPLYLRWWFIAGGLALLLFVAWGWYRLRTLQLKKDNEKLERTVKEKTRALEEKKHDLELSLEEKNMLMKEIHHRVKNNLQVISSLLQIQAAGVEDKNAKNALIESRNRIMSIAVIHQKLYQKEHIDSLELHRLASDLLAQIAGLFPNVKIDFVNDIPETTISIDAAVPLGLIINELMTNSFKYAFADVALPRITLTLEHATDGRLMLRYADNGPGISGGINFAGLQSLGLRLVHGLSGQLQGHVEYTYNNGAVFLVYFRTEKK